MAYLPHFDDPSIFCDSTVFSHYIDTSDFGPVTMTERKTNRSPGPIFPVMPPAHNFSALGNPQKFQKYIQSELPLACGQGNSMAPPSSSGPTLQLPTTDKLRRSDVNSSFLHILLKDPSHSRQDIGTIPWVENDVFPNKNSDHPFDVSKIQATETLYNLHTMSYAREPADMSDPSIRTWLNNLAINLGASHGRTAAETDRSFDASSATRGPAGGYTLLKPDLSVIKRAAQINLDTSAQDRLHWRNIFAFVEITGQKTGAEAHVVAQITEKAACLFDVQHQRKFVCALGIFGEPAHLEFVFAVVDRAGQTFTQALKMEGHNYATFLRIIYEFCFGDPKVLGWDDSMRLDPKTNEVIGITVVGCEYGSTVPTTVEFDVIKLIHSSPILFGRGTKVWIVRDKQGAYFVLKDSWILAANAVSEIEFVKHIDNTIEEDPYGYLFKHSCPSYRMGQDCVTSTDSVRAMLTGRPPARHRRRMVTATIGDPITSFRSKREFVAAYIDLMNGMFLNFLDEQDV